jgi:hypothetical protein
MISSRPQQVVPLAVVDRRLAPAASAEHLDRDFPQPRTS